MKQTRLLMGMPITIELVDSQATQRNLQAVFSYFISVDETFSTYKQNSEITKINNGKLLESEFSNNMKTIFALSAQTKNETNGYFDIKHKGKYDPSGLVKGWAIYQAAQILKRKKINNFYIEAGGDIQVSGKNSKGKAWTVGIRNPFKKDEIVKVLSVENNGVATSGTYLRGQHIYNPHQENASLKDIVSLTVIGPNIYDADRFATAAFAMGKQGISFIAKLPGFEGYMIDKNGIATYTKGFDAFVLSKNAENFAFHEKSI